MREKIYTHNPREIAVSIFTYSELMYGAYKSQNPKRNEFAINSFLNPFEIIDFEVLDSIEYGRIRTDLEKAGQPIGPIDTFIAAHGKSRGLTVVTNNIREFSRVEGLQLEDWTE